MNKNDLITELNSIRTAERIQRDSSAIFILDHPETFPFLIELVFEGQERIHIKAAWILELVCIENISLISAYLDYFSRNLTKITNESALRPIAKVCFFIVDTYFSGSDNTIRDKLTKDHRQRITENNFDWLIENHKVATKAFAMDTLFFLGLEIDWIHEELKLILEKNMIHNSAGYKTRARKILKKLNHPNMERNTNF